jgi:hypothetical protein
MGAPRSGKAQSSCADEVYSYCWGQGRPVDPSTCQCDWSSCLGLPESDCTELSQHLDPSTCTCVSNPAFVGMCDNDPYAFGCPRSFDTVFASQLRVRYGCSHPNASTDPACNPMIGAGDDDICSFDSYAWCAQNGGSWSSSGCACSGVVVSGQTQQQACSAVGGIWYNPGSSQGGGTCYNPSGIGDDFEGTTTTETLASCIASSGQWNPYNCTCTP